MAKYPDSFEQFHRLHKNKQAKTMAGIIAGFVVFFGGLYYLMSATSPSPAAPEIDQAVQPSAIPEEIPAPTEIAQQPLVEQAPVAPVMTPVKKAKKISKHKTSKKIAKGKAAKKDNLVCIPPSRLKALEKQVARASRR